MSQRYQLWSHMALLGVVIFAGLLALLLPLTWQWMAPAWGPFAQHMPFLRDALWGLLIQQPQAWNDYSAWLSQYGLEWAFALHLGLPTLFAVLAAVAVPILLLYVSGGRDPARHIEGPQLFAGRLAHRHARAALQNERQDNPTGLNLHPRVTITILRELGNLLVFGQQGSGKGVVLKPIVAQVIERGDRVMIYDEKREYTPLFFKEQATALISPSDARFMTWDIAADATTPELAHLIATQLIVDDGQDPFWTQGARLIFAGCICVLNARHPNSAWGWPELQSAITCDEAELRTAFERHYPMAARFIEKNNKTTQGLLMAITAKLGWLNTLATAWPDRKHRPFSITQWLNNENAPSVVIVPNDPRYAAISGPLCTALLSLMTTHVLALPDSDSRRLWFALDELGNLPKCPELLKWLSLGRSKGARTIAGFQAMSQVREIYGNDQAETLLSLFTNVVSLRCGVAGGSAETAAKSFGERIVERPVVSTNHLNQRSTTYQRSTEPLVRPDDLTQLPQADRKGVQGYLSVAGWNASYRLTWPYPTLPKQAADYEPAAWLTLAKSAGRRGRRG